MKKKWSVLIALLKLKMKIGNLRSEVDEVRKKWSVATALKAYLNMVT